MFTETLDTTTELVVVLLTKYSFDLSGYTARELISHWAENYPTSWVRLAVIEALYQGRYKAVSVEQLLAFWQRRGQAMYHFNSEFERLICQKFPRNLNSPSEPVPEFLLENYSSSEDVAANPVAENTLVPVTQPESKEAEASLPPQEEAIALGGGLRIASTPSPRRRIPVSQLAKFLEEIQANKQEKVNQATTATPASASHSPIAQFTPTTSNSSEVFTSKLKAIAQSEGVGSRE